MEKSNFEHTEEILKEKNWKSLEEISRDGTLCQEISEKFHEAVGKDAEFVQLWNWTKENKFRKIYAISKKQLEDYDVQKTSNFGIKMGRMKGKFSENPFFVSAIDCDTREFYDFAISYLKKIRPNIKPFEIIKRNNKGEISKNPNIIIITEGSCWPRKTLDYKRDGKLIGQILLSDTYLFSVGNFKRQSGEEIHCEHNGGEIIVLKEKEILSFYEAFEKEYPNVKRQRVNRTKPINREDRVWRNKDLVRKIQEVEGLVIPKGKTKEIESFEEDLLREFDEEQGIREMRPHRFLLWQDEIIRILGLPYASYFKRLEKEQEKYEKSPYKNKNFKTNSREDLNSRIARLVSFKENGENYTNEFFFESIRELIKEFGDKEVKLNETHYFDYIFSFLRKTSKPKESYFNEFSQTVQRVSLYQEKNNFIGSSLESIALPSFLLERSAPLPEHGEKTEFVFEFLKYIYHNYSSSRNYIFHSSTLRRTVYPYSGSVCDSALNKYKWWLFEKAVELFRSKNKGSDKGLLKTSPKTKQIYTQTVFNTFSEIELVSQLENGISRGPPIILGTNHYILTKIDHK